MTEREIGLRHGFRSGLEEKVADQIREQGLPVIYEPFPLKYLVPERWAKYTKDYVLHNGIVIETKGQFKTADRQKHLLIKDQHPELDIRFVFSNSRQRISKTSNTSYADWCLMNDFKFADKWIPQEWLDEPPSSIRIGALQDAGFDLHQYLDDEVMCAVTMERL